LQDSTAYLNILANACTGLGLFSILLKFLYDFRQMYVIFATSNLKSKVTMHIANPIYDVVFKFMMEDSRVAKAFLSAIIQEKVTELDFDTTESTVRIPSKTERETETGKKPEGPGLNLTVCRFDFSARISLLEADTRRW
jgi:hypothetical protein